MVSRWPDERETIRRLTQNHPTCQIDDTARGEASSVSRVTSSVPGGVGVHPDAPTGETAETHGRQEGRIDAGTTGGVAAKENGIDVAVSELEFCEGCSATWLVLTLRGQA